jgi:transcriptional regulator with GAF, ATPase, and Fis domain
MFDPLPTNHEIAKTGLAETSMPHSLETQLGVLKEVAQGLLRQLDHLKPNTCPTSSMTFRNFHEEVREFEIELINTALSKTQGHQRQAAKLLGLKVTTLNAKMKRYNIMSRFYLPISETNLH